ncbi:MAG: hypothetical protein ACOX1U_09370 [Saccharofermentanales bacterium]|jgi:uncharacterized membrane protein YvbJ
MKCAKCGTDNPDSKNVCTKCGNFLYSANPKNRHPLTAEQKSARRVARVKGATLGCLWTFLIVLGVFVFLGVIIFLLFRFVFPPDFIDFLAPAASSVFNTTS